MDLAIAAIQVATVVDVRRRGRPTHAIQRGRDDFARRVFAGHRRAQCFHRRSIRRAGTDEPHPHAIAIRRSLATARMRTTWLAAIFQIHTEHDGLWGPPTVAHGVVAHTREADLVRWRTARLRPADPVARVAESVLLAGGRRVLTRVAAIRRMAATER